MPNHANADESVSTALTHRAKVDLSDYIETDAPSRSAPHRIDWAKNGFYTDHPFGVNGHGEMYLRWFSSITGTDFVRMYGGEPDPSDREVARFRLAVEGLEYEHGQYEYSRITTFVPSDL